MITDPVFAGMVKKTQALYMEFAGLDLNNAAQRERSEAINFELLTLTLDRRSLVYPWQQVLNVKADASTKEIIAHWQGKSSELRGTLASLEIQQKLAEVDLRKKPQDKTFRKSYAIVMTDLAMNKDLLFLGEKAYTHILDIREGERDLRLMNKLTRPIKKGYPILKTRLKKKIISLLSRFGEWIEKQFLHYSQQTRTFLAKYQIKL